MLSIKKDFPIFNSHPDITYLDNAATSQKPEVVIDAISDFYKTKNANVHRGIHKLSELASEEYELARKTIAQFINTSYRCITFTRNTTEATNLVADSWGKANLKKGDTVLVTLLDHHSNILPWLAACKSVGAKLKILDLGITIENLANISEKDILANVTENIDPSVKVLAFPHASNVTGMIFPVRKICKIAKEHGILTVVDGAQAIPNIKVDVHALGCDFYAFSGHKMLGPTGIGVLYGREELLNTMPVYQVGGGMILDIDTTTLDTVWKHLPEKFEAGTPSIADSVGLMHAVKYIESLGQDNILEHERKLLTYLRDELAKKNFAGLKIVGDSPVSTKTGILSFYIEGMHAHDIAAVLSAVGVAVRSGHHCTMPLHRYLNLPATVRASLYAYNDETDVDKLIAGIEKVYKTLL